MSCEIGSLFGIAVALSHLAMNVVLAVSALWVFFLVAPASTVLLRLALLALPSGAIVNSVFIIQGGCRDVAAGEWLLSLGVTLLMVWLVGFHRHRLEQYRREGRVAWRRG